MERAPIKVRKMGFPFAAKKADDDEAGIPRHWLGGSPLASHLANGINLLFPAGERFFVRSVRAFTDQIDDPKLAAEARGFAGQEVRHGMEHERFFDVLREQGYEIDRFLAVYEKLAFGIIEPIAPKKLRLAVTAAAEHFTASFAEMALGKEAVETYAHPVMRDLLLWHAAEEIEHKAVAFDVLKKVAPSYALRVGGLAVATALLVGFWMAGTVMLLRQEPGMTLGRLLRERREGKERGQIGPGDIRRAFVEYLRPDFHPWQNDNYKLAKDYFERLQQKAA